MPDKEYNIIKQNAIDRGKMFYKQNIKNRWKLLFDETLKK